MALRFHLFCCAICSCCNVFCVFLGGNGRAATPAAGKMETATGTGVIAVSAALPTFAVVDRASNDNAAADSGQGISLGVFFWDSRRTYWTRIRSTALTSEYPFALIAAGIESLVSGFASLAWKKTATFLARSSTLYSLLFVDIVELFRRERENRVCD
jgi:hypothetical protein